MSTKQDILKGMIKNELRFHAFELPPRPFFDMIPETIPDTMPITGTGKKKGLSSGAFDKANKKCCSEGPIKNGLEWPSGTAEESFYHTIQKLLNDCIKIGYGALDDAYECEPTFYYRGLRFMRNRKPAGDMTINSAVSLKPDLIGFVSADENLPSENLPAEAPNWWWGAVPESKSKGTKSDPQGVHVEIVVEVKGQWPELVSQAATYARSQFAANTSRTFVLVLGFNHSQKTMRFMLYHRSGVTATTEIELDTLAGRKDFMKIFLRILSWTSHTDAGFPAYTDGVNYFFREEGRTGYSVWRIVQPFFRADCVSGRATDVNLLEKVGHVDGNFIHPQPSVQEASGSNDKTIRRWRSVRSAVALNNLMELPRNYSNGEKIVLKESWQALDRVADEMDAIGTESQFGVEKIIGSEEAKYDNGNKQSTSVLVPRDKVAQYVWPLYIEPKESKSEATSKAGNKGESKGQTNEDPNRPPTVVVQSIVVEERVKVLLVVETEGKSLLKCSSSWELCESIAHCLLGWLNIYQRGYLHRDISIGNVMAISKREMNRNKNQTPFIIKEEYRPEPTLEEEPTPGALLTAGIQSAMTDLRLSYKTNVDEFIKRLIDLAEKELTGKRWMGFVGDGDMAKNWKAMFEGWDEDTVAKSHISGTVHFMSRRIRSAIEDRVIYLQSPIDDLESFYHVFVWAILHNELSQETLTPGERKFRDMLSGSSADRFLAQKDLLLIKFPSRIVSQLKGVIKAWDNAQNGLQEKWLGIDLIYDHLAAIGSIGQGSITEQAFWKWAWDLIAFEGVQQILDIIYKHREELTAYPSLNEAVHA